MEDEEWLHRSLKKLLEMDGLSLSITVGDESIENGSPDKFLHFEIIENSVSKPVEYSSPSMIPLSDRSIVGAVWEEDDSTYEVYCSPSMFEKEFL